MISVLEFGRLAHSIYKDAVVLASYRSVINSLILKSDFDPVVRHDGFYEVFLDSTIQSKSARSH